MSFHWLQKWSSTDIVNKLDMENNNTQCSQQIELERWLTSKNNSSPGSK